MDVRLRVGAVVASLITAATVLLPASPAAATIDVVVDVSVLRVYLEGSGGESAAISCNAGVVRVNTTNTALSCATATSLQVNGSAGPDTIDFSAVTDALFPNVTQVSGTGNGGADVIVGSELATNFFGGAGTDTMTGGAGPDYFQPDTGLDTMNAGGGADVVFSATGTTIDLGPGDDIVYSIWPAGRPAAIDAGTGFDRFLHSGSQLEDKLFLQARGDGGYDLVDTMPTASDVITVPPSFEELGLQTVLGPDLVWVNGLSPSMEVVVNGSAGATLEVMGKGPTTETPTQVTQAGSAPVTFSAMSNVLAFGALASGNHSYVHAAAHDLGGSHLTTSQVNAVAAKLNGATLTRTGYAQQLVGSLAWRQDEAERIFYAYLRRGLDPSGRTYYAEKIRTGTKLNTIRATVLGSSEYFRNRASNTNSLYIDAVYFDVLHRLPDPGGKAYWLGRLNNGVPRQELATKILNTDEPVREFIRYHFRDLLGRDPLVAEFDAWKVAVRDQAAGERNLQVSLVGSIDYLGRHD